VRYEPEQIPIAILPAETKLISFVYRGYEVKKEEDFVVRPTLTLRRPRSSQATSPSTSSSCPTRQ
jgi:hypothetical protein